MNYRQVEKVLLDNGFKSKKTKRGSHRKFSKVSGVKSRIVTIPYHGKNRDLKPGLVSAIRRQSGLTKEQFK